MSKIADLRVELIHSLTHVLVFCTPWWLTFYFQCRIVEEEASDKDEQEHQLAILELLKKADRLRRRLKKPSGKREKRKLQVLQADQS